MNIYYDFFFNWQTEKKHLFWTNKKFVFFFNSSSWEKICGKKFVKQIGEIIWWIRYKFVGADVTHPAPDQMGVKPSIAAIVASIDPAVSKYICEVLKPYLCTVFP